MRLMVQSAPSTLAVLAFCLGWSIANSQDALDRWSFQPPERVSIPQVKNSDWPRSDIDRFILASLEEHGLTPNPHAPSRLLVRRLFFVITGLPPSPADASKWAKSIGPGLNQGAIAELVDHLLDSPRFGERWAQHWLDVAGFAESTGGDSNNLFPHAWRYRNYVIAALNEDKPFDQFIREQIAGDLLPIASDREWADNLVATGFLATGQKLVGEVDDRKFFADLVDEQIDTTTRAFLGLSVACARCHDHKTDPISQVDYYSMAAIFRNTVTHFGLLKAQARQFSPLIDVTSLGLPTDRKKLAADEFAELKAVRDSAVQKMDDLMKQIRSDGEKVTRANLRRSRTKRDEAENALQSYDQQGQPRVFIMGVQDREERLDTRVLIRGELDKPDRLVEPGWLSAIGSHDTSLLEGSGRIELAEWIASEKNPLTSRVMVNRLWHWLFGQGLVRTMDDFGATGESPSHPSLLDYLALRFVEHGWSLKNMIREIVLTRTWQQSTRYHLPHFEIDPDNRYLWRANQRRLEGEAIRDAMLFAGGNLRVTPPRNSLLAPLGEGTVGQNVFEPEIRNIQSNLRSIYLPRVRSVLPESLELFDCPDASNVFGARGVTTVPLQALYSMNHSFPRQQAEDFAKRLVRVAPRDRIETAYLAAFGRLPTANEKRTASIFSEKFCAGETSGSKSDREFEALTAYCHALFCTAEFAVID